jgi:hypothetical protein
VKYAIIALAALLSGCASAPPISSLAEGLARSQPVELRALPLKGEAALLGGRAIKGKLGPDSPVVRLEQGNSYYQLFRLTPSQGPLRLRVTSYCACFGFDKRVAVPELLVLNRAGDVLAAKSHEYSVEGAHGVTPLSVTLDIEVPGPDAAYALVASDNSRLGESINHINVVNFMQLDVSASPMGRFDLDHAPAERQSWPSTSVSSQGTP